MAASAPPPANGTVLNSWKEIAKYLGRGVRTVQRYERDLGLPVRRPHGKSRSSVIAIPADLDEWLRNAPTVKGEDSSPPRNEPAVFFELGNSVREARELCQRCRALRAQNREARHRLLSSIHHMHELKRRGQLLREELSSVGEGPRNIGSGVPQRSA